MLFEKIGDYMKGKSDLDDVKSDPEYRHASAMVKDMVSFYTRSTASKANESFITNNFDKQEPDSTLTNEIANIRFEINENKLNEITADWVREWHEKKQKIGTPDKKSEEIRSFITDAINTPVGEPEQMSAEAAQGIIAENIVIKSITDLPATGKNRSLFIRYSSLAAAALIGVFILIRTLIPSSDTAQLFESNYRPFDAMSTITRGANNSDAYSSSIEKYKAGDYQTAALGFAAVLNNDPSSISSKFYLGLTSLALKNYEQAENLLSEVVNNSGEFGKEARWYLGLTYLETGNKQKAASCFKFLAGSQGFYTERSEKILRRLK
jgi:TolA-binding protein